MKKRDSSFLLGIEKDGNVIFDPVKIRKEAINYYNKKFWDEDMVEKNLQTIKNLHIEHKLKDSIQLMILSGIDREMELFPIHTTYGPDLLLPRYLTDKRFRFYIKSHINTILADNQGEIPNDSLAGRLILLTKTGHPISDLNNTRPILVQNIIIRLIEKVIKTELEKWINWHNLKVDHYQCGFMKKNSTLVNLVRVKNMIVMNKKKRNKNKPIIFSLDIARAFDNIPRHIILEAIKKKIKSTNCWKWQKLWAFSAQLLKPATGIYDDWEEDTVKITKGTPQGGVLSPMFFIMALDLILKSKNSITLEMIEKGKLLAFADDIIISILPDEALEVELVVKHLEKNGLSTNPSKWFYIAPKSTTILDRIGKHQTSIKYLGTQISYNKIEQIKSIKNSIKKNIFKLRKFGLSLPTHIFTVFVQAFYKSLTLYHLGPSLLVNELNPKEAKKIIKSVESKTRAIPAWCSSDLLQSINPNELTISWILRTVQKQILNLRENKLIKTEMSQWLWRNLSRIEWTGWMLWRQGFKLDSLELNKILDHETFRIVMQINRNIFHELDHDNKVKYLCPCSKVWDKFHRLNWISWPVSHLRLFSIKNHETYYSKGPFDARKYLEDIKLAKINISKLIRIDKRDVKNSMWDDYTPKVVSLDNTHLWIKQKFQMTLQFAEVKFITEGEEYKVFENLRVAKNWWYFIPIPDKFENLLMNKRAKPEYLICREDQILANQNQEMEKHISVYMNSRKI